MSHKNFAVSTFFLRHGCELKKMYSLLIQCTLIHSPCTYLNEKCEISYIKPAPDFPALTFKAKFMLKLRINARAVLL